MLRLSSPTVRNWRTYWLAWTAAGLFYISQDLMTRLSRNEPIPWRNVIILWMAAMYVCAAFMPPILRLGRRWTVDELTVGGPSRFTSAPRSYFRWYRPRWKCRCWWLSVCTRRLRDQSRSPPIFGGFCRTTCTEASSDTGP